MSNDTRGMAFSSDGTRLYVLNRRPPALHVIDASAGPTGTPKHVAIGAHDVCRTASVVAVGDAGHGDRVYVTCFQEGELYMLDPLGGVTVEDIVTVGRGPYAVALSSARKKLFVTNFLEDTIAVLDVDPASPTYNRVVLRIGKPRG